MTIATTSFARLQTEVDPESSPNRHSHLTYGLGAQNGPVWDPYTSMEDYLASLPANRTTTARKPSNGTLSTRASTGYWLADLGEGGKAGIAPLVKTPNYKFWRNVKSYGAKGNGIDDDAKAINAAIAEGNRCGEKCGNTFAQGAIIYFPVCWSGQGYS